ncbi:MAG: hypothetical protein ACOX1Y_13950 [Zhaonellaceae bacterium]|jgi:hypothetical protein|nr:hypothetical protein [Clostridia bacterium]
MYDLEEIAPGLCAYAATITFKADEPLKTALWRQQSQELFNYLAKAIKETPQTVIGHIKGYLNLKEQGYYYFSNVGKPPTFVTGEGEGETETAQLDINVLVFNLPQEEISVLLKQGLLKHFSGVSFQVEEEREE